MLWLAFLVSFACAVHPAFVVSTPVDSSFSLLQPLKNAADDELTQNLTALVRESPLNVDTRQKKMNRLRQELIVLAASDDPHYSMTAYSAAEHKQVRVLAKSVEELAGRLDTMEVANDLIRECVLDAVRQTDDGVKRHRLMWECLDKKFQDEKNVREMYGKLKEKYDKEVPLPTLIPFNLTSSSSAEKKKFVKLLMNVVFVNFIHQRPATPRDLFLFSRSMVELAKDAKKFDQVQSIYEETVGQHAEAYNFTVIPDEPTRIAASVFLYSLPAKVKENVKKHPSLYEELLTVQKDVSQRSDWNREAYDRNLLVSFPIRYPM